ncbi:MAG: hypothetical protein WBC73_00055, partial [Phormidesmis sp.]
MVDDQHLDIVTYNKNALNNLRRAVVLGQGQFSLVLARVNYRQLREVLLASLSEHLRFKVVTLPPSATRLREAIAAGESGLQPIDQVQALMVIGLDEVHQLESFLKAANLGRDELPKAFRRPVVLWVDDKGLQHLNRYAPDLKSFAATPIRFEYPVRSLVTVLTTQANATFSQILNDDSGLTFNDRLPLSDRTAEPLANRELSFALAQLEAAEQEPQGRQQAQLVDNELLADLLFLQGRTLHQQGDWQRARSYYEKSLTHWQQSTSNADKQAVLLFHLGLWWCSQAALNAEEPTPAWQKARRHFEACLDRFRQQNQPDRVARFILPLADVLYKLEDWSTLSAIAQEGITLHQDDPARLARDYGYLADVALAHHQLHHPAHHLAEGEDASPPEPSPEQSAEQSSDWPDAPQPDYLSEVQSFAQQALQISKSAQAEIEQRQPDSVAALRYHRSHYLYLLAVSQQLQGQAEDALIHLEQAWRLSDPRDDLSLYRRILERLWQLYYEHKYYAQAFTIKLAQRRIENLFGLRAFIGAGQIQPQPALPLSVRHPHPTATQPLSQGSHRSLNHNLNNSLDTTITAEIKASGRVQDIEAIASRLAQPRYPIVVIHGQSGVGKSSTLSAGLIPKLQNTISEGRTTLPLLIDSYSSWQT